MPSVQDVRYALRLLRRTPGFTAVAILTLALGIGATTAVFSLIDVILLSRLPYAAPDRLVSITGPYPNGGVRRDAQRTARRWMSQRMPTATLHADRQRRRPSVSRAHACRPSFFRRSALQPAMGRWLRAG